MILTAVSSVCNKGDALSFSINFLLKRFKQGIGPLIEVVDQACADRQIYLILKVYPTPDDRESVGIATDKQHGP